MIGQAATKKPEYHGQNAGTDQPLRDKNERPLTSHEKHETSKGKPDKIQSTQEIIVSNTKFSQLPQIVQDSFINSGNDYNAQDYEEMDFKTGETSGYQGVWVAPELCYDFNESNYSLRTINLTNVVNLDVGAATAGAYIKTDDNLQAWIVIDNDDGDGDHQIYECI